MVSSPTTISIFLFSQIKKEFRYGYVPEFHKDIKNLNEYYISPQRNNFYVARNENDEIIATIGICAYDKISKNLKENIQNTPHPVFGDYL